MRIAFTGTRKGLTTYQLGALQGWALDWFSAGSRIMHGMAIGADAEFHRMLRRTFGSAADIEGWPSDIKSQRDDLLSVDTRREPMRPLLRNLQIIQRADVLLAAPAEMEEQQRGGTWSTIRAARRRGMTEENGKLEIFWPEPKA